MTTIVLQLTELEAEALCLAVGECLDWPDETESVFSAYPATYIVAAQSAYKKLRLRCEPFSHD